VSYACFTLVSVTTLVSQVSVTTHAADTQTQSDIRHLLIRIIGHSYCPLHKVIESQKRMWSHFSLSFFNFLQSLKLIQMYNWIVPMTLFLFFDQSLVTWKKLKNVKMWFWGSSSCPIQLGCGRLRKILVGSEVVCEDSLRRMVRKLCWLMSKWFYTDFFLLCLFRVDFLNKNSLHFCVSNFLW
jgi:hypothetical protein